jgi:hypothetical protein
MIEILSYIVLIGCSAALVVFITPRRWGGISRIAAAILTAVIGVFVWIFAYQWHAIQASPEDLQPSGAPYAADEWGRDAAVIALFGATFLSVPTAIFTAVVAGIGLYLETLVRPRVSVSTPPDETSRSYEHSGDPSNPYEPPASLE